MMFGGRATASVYPILRRRAARDAMLTGVAAIAVAGVGITFLGLSSVAFAKACGVVVALGLLAAPHLKDHVLDHLGPANHLTLLRAVLVSAMAVFVGEAAAAADHAWFLVAAATAAFGLDWLDGRVARATGSASPFGAQLDMELDGITVLVLSGLVMTLGHAGAWVLLAGLARYLFIAAGWAWPALAAELPPDPRRAIACGVGITLLVASLAPWPVLAPWLALGAVITLVGSFVTDVFGLLTR